MRHYQLQIIFLLGVAVLTTTCQAEAQTAPTQEQPAVTAHTVTGNSIEQIYGTQNMHGLPGSSVPSSAAPGAPELQNLEFTLAKKTQELRTQPPADLDGYIEYVRRDALLDQLRALAKKAPGTDPALLVLLAWNHVALDMTSIDHTTCTASPTCTTQADTFGEQWGPARSSRAMAMVHLAMFEAANTITQKYHSYVPPMQTGDLRTAILQKYGAQPTPTSISTAAAIGEAAYQTLLTLYPRKAGLLLTNSTQIAALILTLEEARHGDAALRITLGQRLGDDAAEAVAMMRYDTAHQATDHSENTDASNSCTMPGKQRNACLEPQFPLNLPDPPTDSAHAFTWTYDPVSRGRVKLGAYWGAVSTFLAANSDLITAAGIKLPGAVTLPIPTDTDPSFVASLNDGAYGPMIPDPHGRKVPVAENATQQAALDKYLFGTKVAPILPSTVHSQYGVRRYGGAANSLPPSPEPTGQGSRVSTPTDRTIFQTALAEFWGYDGVALLCAPPRLYNMIATSFYLDHAQAVDGGSVVGAARYLAVVNLALADAGIKAWDGKYQYLVARPVTYIRYHSPKAGMLPIDANWTPLGQTGSNGLPFNTTPPFPAYPSGHAVFGGAAFTAIATAVGLSKDTGASAFDFVSDEFNGRTIDGSGQTRPYMKVHFASLKGAEWENAESRIWLGIHWQRDADDGIALGEAIGKTVATTALLKCVKSPGNFCG